MKNTLINDDGMAESSERLLEDLKVRVRTAIDGTAEPTATARRFLDAGQVAVYVDDLDRGWEGRFQGVQSL